MSALAATEVTLLLVEDGVTLCRQVRKANTQIEKLSVTDPLLGIFNRRYLHERLPQEAARSRRYGQPLSLVMADLDHFKKINDTYGHQSGDRVLRHAVDLARSALRVSDWIARYGGEEFVTASFGVAAIDGVAASNEDADAMLREADKALYESKRAGRNRVTCGPKLPAAAAPTPAASTA
jgi:PleD family two-component response regulator